MTNCDYSKPVTVDVSGRSYSSSVLMCFILIQLLTSLHPSVDSYCITGVLPSGSGFVDVGCYADNGLLDQSLNYVGHLLYAFTKLSLFSYVHLFLPHLMGDPMSLKCTKLPVRPSLLTNRTLPADPQTRCMMLQSRDNYDIFDHYNHQNNINATVDNFTIW